MLREPLYTWRLYTSVGTCAYTVYLLYTYIIMLCIWICIKNNLPFKFSLQMHLIIRVPPEQNPVVHATVWQLFCPSVTLFDSTADSPNTQNPIISFHPLTFIFLTDADESLVLLWLPPASVHASVQNIDPSLSALGGSSTGDHACHKAPLSTMRF